MATLSHEPSNAVPEGSRRAPWLFAPEVWPSLAITVMWIAVVLDSLFGPDIVTSSGGGTNTSSVPSGVVVALFAFLATWVVARHAFPRDRR